MLVSNAAKAGLLLILILVFVVLILLVLLTDAAVVLVVAAWSWGWVACVLPAVDVPALDYMRGFNAHYVRVLCDAMLLFIYTLQQQCRRPRWLGRWCACSSDQTVPIKDQFRGFESHRVHARFVGTFFCIKKLISRNRESVW